MFLSQLLSIPEVPRPNLCLTSPFKCAPGLGPCCLGLDYLDLNGILQQQKENNSCSVWFCYY